MSAFGANIAPKALAALGSGHERLQLLEMMRGVAAVWVVLHHADLSVTAFLKPIGNVPLVSNGFLGVDFFFVLSGFIIAYSSQRALAAGGTFATYFRSRAVRIYTPYLPVGVGILALYWIFPDVSAAPRAFGTLTSLLLLPTNDPPALSVAWTLVHELIFYAVYGLIFVSRRLLLLVLAAWATTIVAISIGDVTLSRFAGYFFSPLNLCFHLGIVVFYASSTPIPRAAHVLAASAGLTAILLVGSTMEPNRVASAIAFALMVFAASSVRTPTTRAWTVAGVLGAASYSIYLVHNPIISLASRILRTIAPSMDAVLALAIVSIASIAFGILYWLAYERPALRLVRAAFLTGQGARVAIGA